jgi:hypothetical protein
MIQGNPVIGLATAACVVVIIIIAIITEWPRKNKKGGKK